MSTFLRRPAQSAPASPPDSEVEEKRGVVAWVDRRLRDVSPEVRERATIFSVVALGVLDYLVGPEFHLTVFYLVPIGVAAWYGAPRSGYFTSVLATAAWLAADFWSRPSPLPPGVTAWNTGVRLVSFLVVAIILVRLRDSLSTQKALARLDPLTGLENTRAFFDQLEGEIQRAGRYGRVFTLAYLDLDRFKEVNDTLGHPEGDEVLKKVALTMRQTMRASDVTARLGGDEFGIILPETPYAQAEGALEKLRNEILDAMRREGWPVTVSIGAVTFEMSVETAKEALQMADRLMYQVKDDGRNGLRQVLWTGSASDEASGF